MNEEEGALYTSTLLISVTMVFILPIITLLICNKYYSHYALVTPIASLVVLLGVLAFICIIVILHEEPPKKDVKKD